MPEVQPDGAGSRNNLEIEILQNELAAKNALINELNQEIQQLTIRYDTAMKAINKKFKTKELSSQINSARLSFAEAEDMLKYLDIEPGAVSVMGLMNDKDHEVQILIDEDLLKDEYWGCHPCVHFEHEDRCEGYSGEIFAGCRT